MTRHQIEKCESLAVVVEGVPDIQKKSMKKFVNEPDDGVNSSRQRGIIRPASPAQSRSWAPADNQAPRGWYKTDPGPAKLIVIPGNLL